MSDGITESSINAEAMTSARKHCKAIVAWLTEQNSTTITALAETVEERSEKVGRSCGVSKDTVFDILIDVQEKLLKNDLDTWQHVYKDVAEFQPDLKEAFLKLGEQRGLKRIHLPVD